jgi:RNA polymerase sigma factor (sigma-70 family)
VFDSDPWVSRLVAAHRPALLRYLVRYTGDPDQAEDLVQETLIRLREQPPSDRSEPKRWLFTVATNLARDAHRVARRRAALARAGLDHLPTPSPAPDPAVQAERAEVRHQVRAALATLGERERTILLMREEGFTHREIAEAVGTTTGSVGTMIARALDKVARVLAAEVA